ncbi:TlpA family protein disulfide reductase [bacterium]|nr:TlpA family protein disulfide reductase [bacterium]
MKKFLISSAVGLATLTLLMVPGLARSGVDHVGKPAIEIKAQKWLNTKPLSLAALKGKVVVVEFWATWCGPCRASIPHLKELNAKYASKGVQLVSLTDEGADVAEPFVKQNGMDYAIGAGSSTGQDYGVTGIPHAVVVGKDGKVAWEGHPMNGLDQAVEAALK